jgi:primase-like protein
MMGQILHDHYDGQGEGLMLWTEWSQGSAKFDADETAYKWRSFGKTKGRKLGLGTLFRLANEALYAA